MACVILIHPKNKKEKMEILESFSDNLDYDVTTDLKKYVAQRYKVRIVEEEEDGGRGVGIVQTPVVENKNIPLLSAMIQNDQTTESRGNTSTSMNTIAPADDGYGTFIPYRDRMIEPKKENDVAVEVLAGNNIHVIHSIESDHLDTNSEERDTVEEQPVNECDTNPVMLPPESVPQLMDIHNELVLTDVADNTGIPLITDDVGQDALCFDIVVEDALLTNNTTNRETPVAVRRSTRNIKRGRNVVESEDEEEDTQKEKTKSSSVDEAPSTSTVRRSGRAMKRPAYSIDDEDGEDECPSIPTKVSSSSRKQTIDGRSEDRNGIECRKCMKQLNAEFRKYNKAKQHAITHTDLFRYECPVDGCGYKCGHYSNFKRHAQNRHGQHLSAKNIDLTTEQKEELDQMVKECFPVFGTTNDKYKTCAICQTTVLNNSLDQQHPKRHALHHIDFMLYKCNQPKCEFECKCYKNMTEHGRKKHKIEEISKEDTEIELTDDQKKEIDEMFKKCFSSNDINNTVATGIECKKCLKQLSAQYRWYSHAKNHAIRHTNLERYECPVDGCDHKYGNRKPLNDHTRLKHNNRLLSARKIDLTSEQEEELDQMVKECFPEIKKRDGYKVCGVCQVAISNNQHYPKHHSLTHIDVMLYKCNQSKCQHETKYLEFMTKHLRNKHGIEEMPKKDIEIELTDEQKKEIEDMFNKCFPDEEIEEE